MDQRPSAMGRCRGQVVRGVGSEERRQQALLFLQDPHSERGWQPFQCHRRARHAPYRIPDPHTQILKSTMNRILISTLNAAFAIAATLAVSVAQADPAAVPPAL